MKNLIAEVGTESGGSSGDFWKGIGGRKCKTTAAGQNYKYRIMGPSAVSCKYVQ